MKLIAQPEWSFFSSLLWGIKSSQTTLTQSELLVQSNAELKLSADPFYDLLGRFCSPQITFPKQSKVRKSTSLDKTVLRDFALSPKQPRAVEDSDPEGEEHHENSSEGELEEHKARMEQLSAHSSVVGKGSKMPLLRNGEDGMIFSQRLLELKRLSDGKRKGVNIRSL